ncbi:MAG TPA: MXAN_6640 family putative metalloprotease [Ignavibacteriaceae bacterium]|nr:MXAN_6640 family putative metalloprotease [Ignavibacteriaceae bacterium]
MFTKISFFFLLLALSLSAGAQQLSSRQLDSLYYSVVRIKRPELMRDINLPFNFTSKHLKSATSLFNAIRINLRAFSKKQQIVLQGILDRPMTDTSFFSPNGFFKIHFNASGIDTPTYNIHLFAEALDSVYNFAVKNFGYSPPPSDNDLGGDNKYDIYIENTGGGIYGYTVPETQIGSERYTAYTVINNDFTGFYTTGIDAARVTAAHEFAHAIHLGNYINRFFSGDEFIYELSATAMEYFVFNTVKDYLQYLPAYFSNTQNSMGVNGTIEEFALGIWDIYQKNRFGFGIIRKEWELLTQMRAMDAINNAIQQFGSSFGVELNNFGTWMYFTNYRTIPGQYFDDASYYPLVKSIARINYQPDSNIQLETSPASNSFITITNPSINDTLVIIITNSDIQNAINNTNSSYPFSFIIYDRPVNGAVKINDNYFIEFPSSYGVNWSASEILNNLVIQAGKNSAGQISYSFPSPFSYTKDAFLYIPVTSGNNSNVQFNVYSIDMDLVYSSNQTLNYINGQKVIKWNGRNGNYNKLATGVYIYSIKSESSQVTGKFVIIN